MQCELDSGVTRDISSDEELASAWAEVGPTGHLTLADRDRFLQAAKSGSSAIIQHGADGTVHEATQPVPQAEAFAMLQLFLADDQSWQDRVEWTATSDADRSRQRAQDRDLGKTVTDEALRAVTGWTTRIIRQGIRRFFR